MIGCYDGYAFLCDRMHKVQLPRMEHLTSGSITSPCEAIFAHVSIGFIPEDGTTERCHMDAYLVSATRFYADG